MCRWLFNLLRLIPFLSFLGVDCRVRRVTVETPDKSAVAFQNFTSPCPKLSARARGVPRDSVLLTRSSGQHFLLQQSEPSHTFLGHFFDVRRSGG